MLIKDYMRTGFNTVSQRGLQLTFRMHNSDSIPQRVNNRNILLWFKCVLTAFALHVSCMILFDKVLYLEQEKNVHWSPELSQEESFICVLGISNIHISTIFLLNVGTVPTV
jgi:hypothetical protein